MTGSYFIINKFNYLCWIYRSFSIFFINKFYSSTY